jgi:hypothetical protein
MRNVTARLQFGDRGNLGDIRPPMVLFDNGSIPLRDYESQKTDRIVGEWQNFSKIGRQGLKR